MEFPPPPPTPFRMCEDALRESRKGKREEIHTFLAACEVEEGGACNDGHQCESDAHLCGLVGLQLLQPPLHRPPLASIPSPTRPTHKRRVSPSPSPSAGAQHKGSASEGAGNDEGGRAKNERWNAVGFGVNSSREGGREGGR